MESFNFAVFSQVFPRVCAQREFKIAGWLKGMKIYDGSTSLAHRMFSYWKLQTIFWFSSINFLIMKNFVLVFNDNPRQRGRLSSLELLTMKFICCVIVGWPLILSNKFTWHDVKNAEWLLRIYTNRWPSSAVGEWEEKKNHSKNPRWREDNVELTLIFDEHIHSYDFCIFIGVN